MTHLDDPEESSPVHEHPPELELTDEEDELRDRINSQVNPDLTNVEWRVVQMLIAEAHELQDHIEVIRGLLQPSVRTRFPWGHDTFESSFSMYIGGGTIHTGHRYEDYFLFHADRHSAYRNIPQPTGCAFVRWFPQPGALDDLNTEPGPRTPSPEDPTSSTPILPETPMPTPIETPARVASPSPPQSQHTPPSSLLQIHVEATTISRTSPPDPLLANVLSFSRSTPETEKLPESEEGTSSPCVDIDPLLTAMSNLTLEDPKDIQLRPLGARTGPADASVTTPTRCQACSAFTHSRVFCRSQQPFTDKKDHTSGVIENVVCAVFESRPSSIQAIYPDNGPLPDILEKTAHVERDFERYDPPAMIEIEEAPLPFMDSPENLSPKILSPIPETVELPEDRMTYYLVQPSSPFMDHDPDPHMTFAPNPDITPGSPDQRVMEVPALTQSEMSKVSATFYATAPANLWPDYDDHIPFSDNDYSDWGTTKDPIENDKDSEWYMHADQWEQMTSIFPVIQEDFAPSDYQYDGQDQENHLHIPMDDSPEDMFEEEIFDEMDTGTFRHSA
jgi:hypothetical protein